MSGQRKKKNNPKKITKIEETKKGYRNKIRKYCKNDPEIYDTLTEFLKFPEEIIGVINGYVTRFQFKNKLINKLKIESNKEEVITIMITDGTNMCFCYAHEKIKLFDRNFKYINQNSNFNINGYYEPNAGEIYESKLYVCSKNNVLIFTIPNLNLIKRCEFRTDCRDLHIYDSKMYIAHTYNIRVYTLEGELLNKIKLGGDKIYVHRFLIVDDKLFTVDSCYCRVLKYTAKGDFLLEFEKCAEDLSIPGYIFVENGFVYIVDFVMEEGFRIVQYTENGKLINKCKWNIKEDLPHTYISYLNDIFFVGTSDLCITMYE